MPHVSHLAPVAILFLAMTASTVGADESPKRAGTLDTKALDEFLAKRVSDKGIVGLSVAVMEGGKLTFAKGYGVSSLKDHAAVTPDTLFAAGSVTKQFTSACVLLLAEEGKLSIHDKVAKYYPGLTRAGDITLYD